MIESAALPLSPPVRRLHPAWFVVVLLMPVALLNYLDRQMLASMKSSLMADIPGIANNAHWGTILALFKWVYAILSPIGGYVADRFSRRLTICGSLFVWSVVTWGTGHVHSYEQMLWTRSLMGISEAFYMPAALALIADYHLGETRSRAVGLHQMAIYIGVIVGGFSGYVADSPLLGWRFAFAACGIAGAAYALPLVWLLRDVPTNGRKAFWHPLPPGEGWGGWREGELRKTIDSTESLAIPLHPNPPNPLPGGEGTRRRPPAVDQTSSPLHLLWELLTNFSFVLLVLYFTLPALAGWVVRDWMPDILKRQYTLGQGPAGVAATSSWQMAAIAGALLGGWLADRWTRKGRHGPIIASAISMGLMTPAIFGVVSSQYLFVAIAFLVLFGMGWGFFDTNNMPILALIVRPHLRATGYGIMNLVSTSCGGLADWAFGTMRDRNVPLQTIFSIFAAMAMLSIVLVLSIRPKPTLVSQEQAT